MARPKRSAGARGPGNDVAAVRALMKFLEDHDPYAIDSVAEKIVRLTVMRARNTALAITNLLVSDSFEQASMLSRSLFEDLAVGHWLVMQENPDFLIDRFFGHQEATELQERDFVNDTMKLPHPAGRSSQNEARRKELATSFGKYVQRSWWGVRSDGSQVSLSGLVDELEAGECFVPRLTGGAEPILRSTYELSNRWANQQLHHTPGGMPFDLRSDGQVRARDRHRRRGMTAGSTFWMFGQLVYLQLEVSSDHHHLLPAFDALFSKTLQDVFAGGMTRGEVEAALDEARSNGAP